MNKFGLALQPIYRSVVQAEPEPDLRKPTVLVFKLSDGTKFSTEGWASEPDFEEDHIVVKLIDDQRYRNCIFINEQLDRQINNYEKHTDGYAFELSVKYGNGQSLLLKHCFISKIEQTEKDGNGVLGEDEHEIQFTVVFHEHEIDHLDLIETNLSDS
jgi:hypothetical protein